MTVGSMERLEIPGEIDALQGLAERVEAYAEAQGWAMRTVFAVQLCLEEAVSNAIRHGDLAPDARIAVTLRQEDERLVVEVIDPGPAFDPLSAPPPPEFESLETAAIGGRGIALMRKFCPEISYARQDGANHLHLIFPLTPAG